ncbi:MAG: homoserine dehydrogenase [Bacillota bacterium]|nr:homoserine dehydrogenase [Bacillota bacterium]
MSIIKVAILGFGTVGQGVYKTIQSHERELTQVLGKKVEVAAVLIKNKGKERNISDGVLVTTDFNEILALPQLDVIMEAIVEKEPSFTYLQKAIKRGCHIITANKEMFAHHGKELMMLAKAHHVLVGFEATVAGGIPIIQTLQQLLKINRVHHIEGILNGTSNFILTEMREKQQSFIAALKLAQNHGYAEADPTNDIAGNDAFYKLMILSRIAFGEEPDWKNVEIKGITSITNELVRYAAKLGLRFKHIACIDQKDGRITGSVRPVLIGKSHPFYHVEGVENAVNVKSDLVGSITLQGPGAGMFPTASSMIEDLVFVTQTTLLNNHFTNKSNGTVSQESKQIKEYWLISGVKKIGFHSTINWIEELGDATFLINAAEKDVKNLAVKNKTECFFPVFGEFEKQDKEKSIIISI